MSLTALAVMVTSLFVSISIASAATHIDTMSLPGAEVGQVYSQTVTASGGSAPYTWSVTGGQLPVGITLNASTGALSGTPMYNLTYLFTLKAQDAAGDTGAQSLTIAVSPARPVYTPGDPVGSISPTIPNAVSLPNGRVGTDYGTDLLGTGGVAPYRWSISYGMSLPPGLMLTSASEGQIRGVPTTAGSYSFEVKILDSRDHSSTKTFNLVVDPAITTPTISTSALAMGTVGHSYSSSLSATGGEAPYRWNFASGSLPPGLTLSSNGTIMGIPTLAGTYQSHLEVFDSRGGFSGRDFTITISAAGSLPPSSAELTNRLNNLSRLGISVNALVKLPDDGNRFTQADSAVYYIGSDGRRHAFPNDHVFFTWYSDFRTVRVISAAELASIPLGANVTYHPGVKMVKFMTDPKVYAVSGNRTLRWVKTEASAQGMYGSDWNHQVDDISDTFYLDYNFGADINASSDFIPSSVRGTAGNVSDVLPL